MLFALAVFLKSAPVVAVSGGLGGAFGLGSASCSSWLSFSFASSPTSVGSGVKGDFLSSRAYMFSLAWVLDSVGYDKLDLEPFLDPIAEPPSPSELRLSISGTMAIRFRVGVCAADDDVRVRSFEDRSLGDSPSPVEMTELDLLRDDFDDLLLL